MPSHIRDNIRNTDLSARFVASTGIAASPSGAAEVVVANVTLPSQLAYTSGCLVMATPAFTVGATGASARVRIRQNGLTGTVVADSGAITETPGNVDAHSLIGFDPAPGDGQTYALTLAIAAAVTASPVSSASIAAVAI